MEIFIIRQNILIVFTLSLQKISIQAGSDYGHNIRTAFSFGKASLPKTISVNWTHCGSF